MSDSAAHATSGNGPTIADVMSRVPGKVNPGLRGLFAALLVVGALTFALTLAANPLRAWSAVLFNLVYWMSLAQGGVIVAAIVVLARGKFATPMHRVALGMGSFLPWSFLVLALTLIFGHRVIFPWVREPVPAKEAYLNVPFLLIRQIGLVGLLTLVSMDMMRRVRRLDAGLARGRVPDALRARYEKWSEGWKGDALELAAAQRSIPQLSALLIPLYAGVFTVVCWDLVMSLDPHWATTMVGAWFFIGGVLMGWAGLSLLTLILRRAYHLEAFLTPNRYHQIGKLIFAFSIFWTYLFWSMFLPIWYGNLPEETHWIVRRMRQPFLPWSVAAIALTWLTPFSGFMNLAAKRNPATHMFFAAVVLVGLAIERLILVYPSIFRTELPLGVPELGVTLGFLGAFALCFQAYAATRPLIPLDKLEELATGEAH